MEEQILGVEEIAKILRIKPGTLYGKRWQEKSGCPLRKHGKRLLAIAKEFWEWFKTKEIDE